MCFCSAIFSSISTTLSKYRNLGWLHDIEMLGMIFQLGAAPGCPHPTPPQVPRCFYDFCLILRSTWAAPALGASRRLRNPPGRKFEGKGGNMRPRNENKHPGAARVEQPGLRGQKREGRGEAREGLQPLRVLGVEPCSTPRIGCSVPKLCGGELGIPRGPAGGQLFLKQPQSSTEALPRSSLEPGSSAPAGGQWGQHRIPPTPSAPEPQGKLGGNGHEMGIADFCLRLGPVVKMHGGAVGAQHPGK